MIAGTNIQTLQLRIARNDDQQAYKELFTSLYGYLFRFAKTLVKRKESAEEIVSDVFIKVWEKRRELEKIENLKVYLYVTTRNMAYNFLEKQKRTHTNPLDDFQDEFVSVYFDPEQLLITSDMLSQIQRAIDQLPPKCRMVFKLAKEDGLKCKEVAEILNLSVKTVENQITIGLQKIGSMVSFDIQTAFSSSMKHTR